MTSEEAWKLLNKRGITSEEELNKELKENALNIGMFTMPYKKINKEA